MLGLLYLSSMQDICCGLRNGKSLGTLPTVMVYKPLDCWNGLCLHVNWIFKTLDHRILLLINKSLGVTKHWCFKHAFLRCLLTQTLPLGAQKMNELFVYSWLSFNSPVLYVPYFSPPTAHELSSLVEDTLAKKSSSVSACVLVCFEHSILEVCDVCVCVYVCKLKML